jgi:predicted amidophosphoribosyltransferase
VPKMHQRIAREAKTMEVMVAIYCHDQHGTPNGVCKECSELIEYANGRLERCPFQEGKTTCAKCPIHCYRPAPRERMKAVMRHSGPRMLWRHPIMTVFHLWDGLRKEPIQYERETAG